MTTEVNASGIAIPVPIVQGGTAATTAPAALTNLGAVPLAGGTMTGLLVLSGDPVVPLGAATKEYADTIASGITIKQSCLCGSTTALTVVYANGAAGVGATLTNAGAMAAFSTDGVSPSVNDRVLIKNQASTFQNGIYTVTTVGSGAANWVLTRATDYDTAAEIKPGTLVIVTSGTTLATTSWIQTDTVVTVGTDPIEFTQFSAGVGASTSLNNLITTAINQTLIPGSDASISLGVQNKRWLDGFIEHLQTGQTATNAMTLDAYDTGGAAFSSFLTLTAGNPPTAVLASGVTGTTQAASNNSTKLATTAYVDNQVSSIGANRALSNLAAVAINASLVPGADGTLDLGTAADRWRNVIVETVQTGTTAAQTTLLQAYNTLGASYTTFATLTANNPPTMALASAVTATTQAALDNSTKLATTAYVDAATGGGAGANVELSNLSAVAINTSLLPGADATINLGSAAKRFADGFIDDIKTGTTGTQTTKISGYNTGIASYTDFITVTCAATATCSLDGSVTGVTQAANNNSTKLATTAYVDNGVGTSANVHLSNLSAVAINTALLPGADGTIDLGSAADRFRNAIVQAVQTGTAGAQTTLLQAYDTLGATYTTFATLTANNPPTMSLASAVTGTTQAASDNSTKLATTAYADAQVTTIAANKALSNLSAVAINTSLIPGADGTINLGSFANRWNTLLAQNLAAGTTAAQTISLLGYDTSLAAYDTFFQAISGASPTFTIYGTNNSTAVQTPFLSITNANPPTAVIGSGVTATTQANTDNSAKLATTAFVKNVLPAKIFGYGLVLN